MEPLNGGFLVSIGTTHPWNVAGTGLDAHVASQYAIPHASVIAAVSAQDRDGVHALHAIPAAIVAEQLRCLPQPIAAYRIGALATMENVHTVAAFLRLRSDTADIVVDPVMSATLGGALQTDSAMPAALVEEIVAAGAVVTPNIEEASILTGMRVTDERAMTAAGKRLIERGARAALVTGGHLAGDPVDVLVTVHTVRRFSGPRLPGSMRGSGCTLAASLACELSRGADIVTAAERAHAYVRVKIEAATMRGGLQVAF